jgi:RNA polymerase sigma factor (sigma-70 family)
MSDAPEPPDDVDGGVDRAEVEAPPTDYERLLVCGIGDVIAQCARKTAREFPRHVSPRGLMSFEDLLSIGHGALYRAARVFDEKRSPEFAAFARYYVRGAMLDALDDLLFQERITRAAAQAAVSFCGHRHGEDYDVMKHDGAEARRRYRAFANGVLAATFTAGLEEAQRHLAEAEIDERRAYEQAIAGLRAALARLDSAEQRLLALVYGELWSLKAASEALGIPYGTARARHARALAELRERLVEQGLTRAPRPLMTPDAGHSFAARAPPQNDTGGEGPR